MDKIKRSLLNLTSYYEYVLTHGYTEDGKYEEAMLQLCRALRESPTLVISAFPGVGKTHFYNKTDLVVLDSDSSKFDKTQFPANYIAHIKENIGKADIILVSSHDEVRKALVDEGIPFILVYPALHSKEEYIERYKYRGSPESFIRLVEGNWETWIKDCEDQEGCLKFPLYEEDYLSDII